MTLDEAIALAQLEEKRRARVGGLSGGQKQRLAMATALVGRGASAFVCRRPLYRSLAEQFMGTASRESMTALAMRET